jgi:hypothetical protein
MEEENCRNECLSFIKEIKALEQYDYSGFKALMRKFITLGRRNSNYAATEELGKIEVYLEQSQKATNPKRKFENWDDAKTLLIENVEIWIGI